MFTMEKTAVFAPIPSARAATAVIVKAGLLRSIRNDCFRSLSKVSNGFILQASDVCRKYRYCLVAKDLGMVSARRLAGGKHFHEKAGLVKYCFLGRVTD
jgi:hypothetical protein